MNDLRFTLRTLRRHPGFAIVAVLTLAVGIGATTAMFSVVRGVLLEPLPYERPGGLVSLWTRYLPSSGQDIPRFPLSPPELIEYRDQSRLMRDVVPYGTSDRTLGGEGDHPPSRIRVGFLGAGMFDLLGVRAAVGRTFAPEEELPDAAPVIVLSQDLWRSRFGGDSMRVGRNVMINGQAAQVIGVMPERFVFPNSSADAWMPFGLNEATATNRFSHYLLAVGRLAPGVTLAQARQELATITAGWNAQHEHHAMGHFIFLTGLHEDLVGDRGAALWLLMAAAVLVLAIAAVNIANLLLARTEHRQEEIAVRTALGASRGRLLRQFLVESLVLTGVGACLGVLLAMWATPALLAINPGAIPRAETIQMNWLVLAFALAVSAGTALLFSLAPLARTHARWRGPLVGQRTTGTRHRVRMRSVLVGAEAALGVVVVLAAGLVARSFIELTGVDAGVRIEGLLLFDLQLPAAGYGPGAAPVAYDQLLERLRALPGVTSAGATSSVPVADDPVRQDIRIEGRPEPEPGVPTSNVDLVAVHPGYFEALGIPLRAGRLLTRTDREDAEAVAVINATAAGRYWGDTDAVGARVRFSLNQPWITIVGVVGNTRVDGLRGDARAQMYLPHHQVRITQGSTARGLTLTLRTDGDPLRLATPVRTIVAEMDPDLPMANVRSMEHVLATAAAPERFSAGLFGGFALIALLLAAVGVYGVTSYAVARRTREVGIRMALGARGRDVLATVIGDGVRPVIIGAVVGLAAALAGAGALSRFVYNVGVRDPITFVAAPLLLLVVAGVATYLPARRAARTDPMDALRYE